jgi:hypothetical protein
VFLLPLGLWLCAHTTRPAPAASGGPNGGLTEPTITALALIVGVVGGIYGIGGGSILGPLLVGRGVPVAKAAPAALASTYITSAVGAATYGLLSLITPGDIAPNWSIGMACGLDDQFQGVGATSSWLVPFGSRRNNRKI